MASAHRVSNAVCLRALDNTYNNLLNEGLGNGIINIYTGSAPGLCESAATGTLLGTCLLNTTPFAAAVDLSPGGRISANVITPDIAAVAAGTAGYYRAYSSNGGTDATKLNCHLQGSAGEAADLTDMTLDNKVIALGGTIQITAWTISLPEA